MFDVGAPEVILLVILAIVVFGPERLPEFARKAAQVLHYVRGLATQAQEQLGEELGPEFKNMDFRDLNPKQFVKKHLLDEVDPIIADVKAEIADVRETATGTTKDITVAINGAKDISPGGPQDVLEETRRAPTPYDAEAT